MRRGTGLVISRCGGGRVGGGDGDVGDGGVVASFRDMKRSLDEQSVEGA